MRIIARIVLIGTAPSRKDRWFAIYWLAGITDRLLVGQTMIGWIINNWGWLAAGAICAVYFAFYVLAMREQRSGAEAGKPQLPCDRC